MGVSISRPPRCERGALPAELIAPEGSHKLAATVALSHRVTRRVRRRRRRTPRPSPGGRDAGSVRPGQVPSNGMKAATRRSTVGSSVHNTSRASPLGSIVTHEPTRMIPSGPCGSPGSVNWASTTMPMIANTAKNDTDRHGKRAGPRWLGKVGVVGAGSVVDGRGGGSGSAWTNRAVAERCVVHGPTSRVVEHTVRLVDRRASTPHRRRCHSPWPDPGGARGRADGTRRARRLRRRLAARRVHRGTS